MDEENATNDYPMRNILLVGFMGCGKSTIGRILHKSLDYPLIDTDHQIEKQTGKDWSQVVAPKDKDLEQLAGMLADLRSRDVQSFLYVNNHFEGSAPRTIQRISERLSLYK